MRRMLIVAASAMLPACLLFTSLDDTSGGSAPAANEAGTPDAIAPPAESGSDATVDVVSVADAGFCATDGGAGQVFCSEFAGANADDGWSGLAGGVGTLVLDQGNLLAKVPITAQYEQGKHVFQTIDGAFSSLACSFAFRRDVLGEEDISIAELLVTTNAESYHLVLYTAPTFGRLLVQRNPADGGDGMSSETPADVATALGEWHRVTIEATTAQVRVYVDGQTSATLPHLTTPAPLRTTFRLGLPQVDGDNTKAWEMRFDDVRCIRTP